MANSDPKEPDPDFHLLVTEMLPRRLKQITDAYLWPVEEILKLGSVEFAQKTGLPRKVKGLYVFYDGSKPYYVGISRDVRLRIRQHVEGVGHNDASLAFLVARKKTGRKEKRSYLMTQDDFLIEFENAKTNLRRMKVAILDVPHEIERYVLEVYAAMHLRTRDLNSFETH